MTNAFSPSPLARVSALLPLRVVISLSEMSDADCNLTMGISFPYSQVNEPWGVAGRAYVAIALALRLV